MNSTFSRFCIHRAESPIVAASGCPSTSFSPAPQCGCFAFSCFEDFAIRVKSPPSGNSEDVDEQELRGSKRRFGQSARGSLDGVAGALSRLQPWGKCSRRLLGTGARICGDARFRDFSGRHEKPTDDHSLIKSTTGLLGLFTVMPFPAETWRTVEANAIDFATIAPVFSCSSDSSSLPSLSCVRSWHRVYSHRPMSITTPGRKYSFTLGFPESASPVGASSVCTSSPVSVVVKIRPASLAGKVR